MSVSNSENGLMSVESIQKTLGRSRASIYRYANTDPHQLNLPFDANMLNPELRQKITEPLLFHPTEVARFARDILKVHQVTIQVQDAPTTLTNQLLQEILSELKAIHTLLKPKS